jgi:YD repeat-containing protein
MLSVFPALQPAGADAAYTNTYAYDLAGRLIRVNYNRAKSISYAYDKNGNITSVSKSAYMTPAGDIDGNETVDLGDCIMALRIMTRMTPTAVQGGDVDSDGRIGLPEVIYILQTAAEVR